MRAYLLYGEAAVRDPRNPSYRSNRDALAPAAKLLTQADIENADVTKEVFSAQNEAANPVPPIERIGQSDWQSLQPPLQVRANESIHDFDFTGDIKTLIQQVSAAYGLDPLLDHDLRPGTRLHFEIRNAGYRAALEALTAATHTFVYPVSEKTVGFAADTDVKRNELEPVILLSFPLQEALNEKDLIEAANAVRGLLGLRSIGWDSLNRMVLIRDRVTRARVARSLLEALLLPRGQVSFDVQFVTTATDRNYHYGASLQTMFQLVDFGRIGGFKTILPAIVNPSSFFTFGGGATLFGVGVAEATAFAMYTNSVSSTDYDSTVVVADRGTANFHIGDKYPIASSLYTGFGAGSTSIYNPAPQITLEDLGLVLKLTPHINGEGDVDLDLEANFKSLGNQTFNTIPSIAEREFKGSVSLRKGEWAVVAGIDSSSYAFTRTGLAGIGQIPGLKQVLTDTTRDTQTSNTLLVIKPTITRLPISGIVSPQYLIGTRRGERVLL